MRQQLIEWLFEDIEPRIRKSGDTEGEILKFANEHNLSAAQVEAIGQLVNTAKTIRTMEKSAKRTDEFPLLDVEQLVADFLKTPEKKAAVSRAAQLSQADEPGEVPNFFGTPDIGDAEPEQVKQSTYRQDAAEREAAKANFETLHQVAFEMGESAREKLESLVTLAKQGNFDWQAAEKDCLALYADEGIQATLDGAAKFFAACNFKVKRAMYDGGKHLVENGAHKLIKDIHDDWALMKEAKAQIAELEPSFHKAGADDDEDGDGDDAAPAKPKKSEGQTSPSASTPGKDTFQLIERGDAEKSPLKQGPDSLYAMLQPMRDQFFASAHKSLFSPVDDKSLDASMEQAQQAALLQKLMITDPILSNADPDKVVSLYETFRNTAPSLSRDINTARIMLRSAIQHEGVDPFTIKSIADAESAKQKVQQGMKGKVPKPQSKED